jgi:hypothetical protein
MAFVPEPMPRELSLSTAEVRLLSEADYALGRLAGAAGRLVNPYLIGQPLLRREAILSSRIEGTYQRGVLRGPAIVAGAVVARQSAVPG